MVRTFDTPIHTNDQSLDRVLAAGLPVVLVFLNGPAPADLEAAMREAARLQAGKLLVATVQVKDSPASSGRFGIGRTPAVVTFKDGQMQSTAAGIQAGGLNEHIRFLLGIGPKPETRPQPQPAYSQASTAGTSRPASDAGYAQNTASAAGPVTVTDATFNQEVMRSPQPVVVDFWAPWCGPCRMVAPALDKLSREMAGRLRVAKINVDENPAVSQQYGVQSIPTMLIVKDGKIIDRWAGALPEPMLRNRIQQALG